jgi:hypothetical protein
MNRQAKLFLIAICPFILLLLGGCATRVGEWNCNVGPLITNEPYEESGKRKEPVDPAEWRRYYEATRTSDVPAKAQSPQ